MNDVVLKRIIEEVLEAMKNSEENLRKSTPMEEEPKLYHQQKHLKVQ